MTKPIMLMILDGWGYSEETAGNAIAAAKTPNFDKLWQEHPHTLLQASGLAVGLPEGQMGNSEVGHLHIGAGRLAPQDLTRINMVVESGEFLTNPVLTEMADKTKAAGKALHIFGLLSDGGIHSHTRHIQAMIKLAAKQGLQKIYMHAFLDGRDTPPKSAQIYIDEIEQTFTEVGVGAIASIGGRFYAMDRDKRWDRVERAYNMLTQGTTEFHTQTATQALQIAYERDESDEFVQPTAIHAETAEPITITDGDSIIFMNFRADRGRELSYAFTDANFNDFDRKVCPKLTEYVTLTQYAENLKTKVAFPPLALTNVLGEVVANSGFTQLRIAETEKYAHVTYFLNGGEEQQLNNEERILVPSPKVATYDMQPTMSVFEVTDKLVNAIKTEKYDFIACNFANPDMLGHTGKLDKTVTALEAVDECLGRVIAALHEIDGEMVIIADHGNAEKMQDPVTGQPFTAHTCSPVPFIYVGRNAHIVEQNQNALTDVAPTLLYLLDLAIPKEMTGHALIQLES
ncbi:MAG: 2,3-bisphosphoglycerate-independent phosphoglycerate mutase [Gammaproteobacteria bacterium]|nr:2,3-bisphosphoglycerate-independent phosphoglycerate mutase [Gammaproteobacteria bacterium]